MKKQDDHSKNDFFSYATEVSNSHFMLSDLQYVKNKTKSVNNVFQKKKNMNLLLTSIVRYLMGSFQNVKSTSNKSKNQPKMEVVRIENY